MLILSKLAKYCMRVHECGRVYLQSMLNLVNISTVIANYQINPHRGKLTHSSGVLLGLPTLLHFFLSLGMVIASLQLMFACVARSFSQVVRGLPLGLVPCRRPIIRSNVMPPFLTR